MVTRSYETVKLERDGHVAILTFNRPDRMNAVNRTLSVETHMALDELAADAEIRAIILTGAGRGFCAGADVVQMAAGLEGRRADPTELERMGYPTGVSEIAPHLRHTPQPVIAAVNGPAVGGGFGVALACDMRIASEAARFSCIFVKRSLVPDTAVSFTMPRLVGQGVAMEMALTGAVYDAQWALEKGLVNKVVPPEKLMEEAMIMAQAIAANPPICVRSIKQLMYSHEQDLEGVYRRERAANAPAANSEDRKEAVRSFLEKRTPVFKGV